MEGERTMEWERFFDLEVAKPATQRSGKWIPGPELEMV